MTVSSAASERLLFKSAVPAITLHFRELDGDDAAFLERSAKDFQVFASNPATDAENNTLFDRKSVDSAGHGVACRRSLTVQTGRHPRSLSSTPDIRSIANW